MGGLYKVRTFGVSETVGKKVKQVIRTKTLPDGCTMLVAATDDQVKELATSEGIRSVDPAEDGDYPGDVGEPARVRNGELVPS